MQRLEREQKARISAAWHVEAFARMKRLPRLEKLFKAAPPPKDTRRQTPEEIMAAIRGAGRQPPPGKQSPQAKRASRAGVIARTPVRPKSP